MQFRMFWAHSRGVSLASRGTPATGAVPAMFYRTGTHLCDKRSRCVSEPQAYARLKPRQFRGVLRHFKGVLHGFKTTCDLNLRQCRSFHIKGVPRHFKGVPRHFKGVTSLSLNSMNPIEKLMII